MNKKFYETANKITKELNDGEIVNKISPIKILINRWIITLDNRGLTIQSAVRSHIITLKGENMEKEHNMLLTIHPGITDDDLDAITESLQSDYIKNKINIMKSKDIYSLRQAITHNLIKISNFLEQKQPNLPTNTVLYDGNNVIIYLLHYTKRYPAYIAEKNRMEDRLAELFLIETILEDKECDESKLLKILANINECLFKMDIIEFIKANEIRDVKDQLTNITAKLGNVRIDLNNMGVLVRENNDIVLAKSADDELKLIITNNTVNIINNTGKILSIKDIEGMLINNEDCYKKIMDMLSIISRP